MTYGGGNVLIIDRTFVMKEGRFGVLSVSIWPCLSTRTASIERLYRSVANEGEKDKATRGGGGF